MKQLVFLIFSAFLVIAPVGEKVCLNLNQISITYAAKSSKKNSSSNKKKKSTKKSSSKKNINSTKNSSSKKNKTTNKRITNKNNISSKKNTFNSKAYNYSASTNTSVISDDSTCYISTYGECYHRLKSCAGKTNQVSTTVGNVKGHLSKCKKCW